MGGPDAGRPAPPVLGDTRGSADANLGYPVGIQQENRLLRETAGQGGNPTEFGYLVGRAVPIHPPVGREVVRRAVQLLVDRHEAMRTRFRRVGGEFRQFVSDPPPRIEVPAFVVRSREQAVGLLRRVATHLFPADSRLFLRALLLQHDEENQTLFLVTEHLVCDDAGLGILVSQVSEAIKAERNGVRLPAAPEAHPQYKDWVVAQRAVLERVEAAEIGYWRETLGPSGPFPPSDLFDPRDGVDKAILQSVSRPWGQDILGVLNTVATRYRMSRFLVLLFLAQVAVALVGRQSDVVVHSATSNRLDDDAWRMVGWCAHGLPFRIQVDRRKSLEELIRQARRSAMETLRHQAVPLTRIVRALAPAAHGSRRALRPARFYLGYSEDSDPRTGPLKLAWADVVEKDATAQPGLTVNARVTRDGVDLRLLYGEGRMSPERVARVADLMARVLVITASNPDVDLASIAD